MRDQGPILRKLDGVGWSLIAAVAAIVLLSAIVTDFRIVWRAFLVPGGAAALLVAGSWIYRPRRSDPRLSSALACTAQLAAFAAVGAPLSYVAASFNLPLQDHALGAADRALGLDWIALHGWLAERPTALATLRAAYMSLTTQASIAVLCLAFSGRLVQVRLFVLSFVFASLIAIAISVVLPAQGAWGHYGLPLDESAIIPVTRTSWPVFHGLRDGSFRLLMAVGSEGIISFPSLHAALAVILIATMWPVPVLRWLSLAVNITMIAATPIDGSHHFVDLLAGIVLAGLCLAAVHAIIRHASMNRPLRPAMAIGATHLVPGE